MSKKDVIALVWLGALSVGAGISLIVTDLVGGNKSAGLAYAALSLLALGLFACRLSYKLDGFLVEEDNELPTETDSIQIKHLPPGRLLVLGDEVARGYAKHKGILYPKEAEGLLVYEPRDLEIASIFQPIGRHQAEELEQTWQMTLS